MNVIQRRRERTATVARGRRAFATSLAMGAAFLLWACAGTDEPAPVVLYASADDFLVRDVIERFQTKTGVHVRFLGDTEATKTTALVNRLRAERDRPQADVFWSSEAFLTIQLAEEGVLDEHLSDATRDWPDHLRDARRRWYGFAARARVVAYAPDRVHADDVPRTWLDLGHERWRGRIVMADPRFGTTRGHLGAMLAYFESIGSPQHYTTFLESLRANEIRLLTSGNAGVVRAIARGEADVGLTDTDDVWAAKRAGERVELVYPAHGRPGVPGEGTLLIPNTVARVRNGPNPAGAARLIDFLLSAEVERLLAESDSHNVPTRPGLAEEFARYAVPNPLAIDYRLVAEAMDEAVERAMISLSPGGR